MLIKSNSGKPITVGTHDAAPGIRDAAPATRDVAPGPKYVQGCVKEDVWRKNLQNKIMQIPII